MHDLASADSRDIPRSACFESKAPTCLAFLLLNQLGLLGYEAPGQQAGMAQVRGGAACECVCVEVGGLVTARVGCHRKKADVLCRLPGCVCSRRWRPSWLWARLAGQCSSSAQTP